MASEPCSEGWPFHNIITSPGRLPTEVKSMSWISNLPAGLLASPTTIAAVGRDASAKTGPLATI